MGTVKAAESSRAELYRRAIAEVPDAILLLDANGLVVDATAEITASLGHERADLVGLSALLFVHPADHARCATAMLQELTNPTRRAPAMLVRVRHADGSFRDVELLGLNRFDDPSINGLLLSLRDVSGPGLGDRVMAAGDYLYRTFETVASDGVCIFDSDGNRAYASPSICQVLGYTEEELRAVSASGLVVPEDLHLWKRTVLAAMRAPATPHRVECRLMHKSRGALWIETTVVNLLDDPAVQGVVCHIRDIDARRRAEAELQRQARLDPLTQLGNRTALMERLTTPSVGSRTVLFADLDNFKQVNDRFGHAEGDRVISAVGAAIAEAVGESHFVARNGGDEFCVVADGLDEQASSELTLRLRLAVLAAVSELGVGISIGVGHTNVSGDGGDEHLLVLADRKMYSEKHGTEAAARMRTTEPRSREGEAFLSGRQTQ